MVAGVTAPMWFVIASGPDEGRPHMVGWMLTAIKGEQTSPRNDGWMSLGFCPRCNAVVCTDGKQAYGDRSWGHELWHALTDWPVPAEVLAQIPDPAVRRAYTPQAARNGGQ